MASRRNKSYPIVVRDLEVTEVYNVTPLMRRVVVSGEQLGPFVNNGYEVGPFLTENADDHVKLIIGRAGVDYPVPAQEEGHLDWSRQALDRARDYTPRRFDPVAKRLELDFVRHGGGLASTWADEVQPGERVLVAGPRGTTVLPDDIDWYLLVGDETALPAIARRIEELPAGTPVTAVVTIPTASEEQTFDHETNLDITWVHRDRAPLGMTWDVQVMEALEKAPWREGQVYAWAAGESQMLRPVRRWLKEVRKVPRSHTDIAGYWRDGASQSEMGEITHKLDHAVSLSVPYAARVAVSLDLAEHVADGHGTISSLAEAAGATASGVRKIVKLLSFHGLFELGADDSVRLGRLGTVLTEEYAHSRLDRRSGYARLDDGWPGLLHAVTTGESGYRHAVGESLWDTLSADPQLGESFDRTLSEWSGMWCRAVASALSLNSEHVVDVGGGTGELLAALLESSAGTCGTLVELPSSAERARVQLAERGLGDRTATVPQSFFEPVPVGGDIYVLAQVLHNWPDAEAQLILSRVAEAAGSARVLIVERISGAGGHDHDAEFDLLMFAAFGGGERTVAEYAALAAESGLELVSAVPILDELHLIELRRAES
ncbi:siderophore-interacting protein [Actinomycetaceae bacterium L2_0104]